MSFLWEGPRIRQQYPLLLTGLPEPLFQQARTFLVLANAIITGNSGI